MNPLAKLIIALFLIAGLVVIFPLLFLMAFYAESNSYTMNFIGRTLFIPYSIFALLALVSFIKNLVRVYKGL